MNIFYITFSIPVSGSINAWIHRVLSEGVQLFCFCFFDYFFSLIRGGRIDIPL